RQRGPLGGKWRRGRVGADQHDGLQVDFAEAVAADERGDRARAVSPVRVPTVGLDLQREMDLATATSAARPDDANLVGEALARTRDIESNRHLHHVTALRMVEAADRSALEEEGAHVVAGELRALRRYRRTTRLADEDDRGKVDLVQIAAVNEG